MDGRRAESLPVPPHPSSWWDRHLPFSARFIPPRPHPSPGPLSIPPVPGFPACPQRRDQPQLPPPSPLCLPAPGFGMCHCCVPQVLPIFTARPPWCGWKVAGSWRSWRVRVWTFACPSTSHLPAFAISAIFRLCKRRD